ncbi:MAG: hypothetical protein ACFFAU_01605 [Candidatus Hodarchaeota archaeon]
MWIESREKDLIQRRLARFLKREVDSEISYRLLVEDLVRILDRKLAFILIASIEGYNGCEIAACLGVSSSTVTQYKKKLRKIIRKLVNGEIK